MRIRSDDRRTPRAKRSAFSLLELVVVILIVIVLAALAAAATAKFIAVQRSSNTKTTLQKIDREFQKQWAAALDNAKTEANSAVQSGSQSTLLAMAGNDVERARVMWVKLRMRSEFPANFTEVFNWNIVDSNLLVSDLPPLQGAYQTTLSQLGVAGGSNPPGPNESAVCLLMAMSLGRRGSVLNPDVLGSGTLAPAPLTNNPTGTTTGLKMLVDGWGKPLWFYRYPWQATFTTSSATQTLDPLDPTGRLMAPDWNNSGSASATWPNNGAWVFEQLCHPVHLLIGGAYTPVSFNLIPTIASAGPDNSLGLDANTAMQIDNTANDNLYNHP